MATASPRLLPGRRYWASRAAILAGAGVAGLVLQHVVTGRLEAIENLSHTDVLRARAELALLLRVGGVALFGLTAAVGVAMIASARRALGARRFPPPGVWSFGAVRVVSGEPAVRLARASAVLGVLLVACSLAGGALVWHMASVLLACRA